MKQKEYNEFLNKVTETIRVKFPTISLTYERFKISKDGGEVKLRVTNIDNYKASYELIKSMSVYLSTHFKHIVLHDEIIFTPNISLESAIQQLATGMGNDNYLFNGELYRLVRTGIKSYILIKLSKDSSFNATLLPENMDDYTLFLSKDSYLEKTFIKLYNKVNTLEKTVYDLERKLESHISSLNIKDFEEDSFLNFQNSSERIMFNPNLRNLQFDLNPSYNANSSFSSHSSKQPSYTNRLFQMLTNKLMDVKENLENSKQFESKKNIDDIAHLYTCTVQYISGSFLGIDICPDSYNVSSVNSQFCDELKIINKLYVDDLKNGRCLVKDMSDKTYQLLYITIEVVRLLYVTSFRPSKKLERLKYVVEETCKTLDQRVGWDVSGKLKEELDKAESLFKEHIEVLDSIKLYVDELDLNKEDTEDFRERVADFYERSKLFLDSVKSSLEEQRHESEDFVEKVINEIDSVYEKLEKCKDFSNVEKTKENSSEHHGYSSEFKDLDKSNSFYKDVVLPKKEEDNECKELAKLLTNVVDVDNLRDKRLKREVSNVFRNYKVTYYEIADIIDFLKTGKCNKVRINNILDKFKRGDALRYDSVMLRETKIKVEDIVRIISVKLK